MSKFQKEKKKRVAKPAQEPQPKGRGMTRRADKYHAQKIATEPLPDFPVMSARPRSPDDFHSAREPSEFEYESGEMSCKGSEEEDHYSEYLTTSSAHMGHDTDHTERSNTENQSRKWQKQKLWDNHALCSTNAKKENDKKNSKIVISLFWGSQKEGTQQYKD